jgi:hypothetical protein
MTDKLADILMDADIGMDLRVRLFGAIGPLVDGTGLKVCAVAAKTGIPHEHAEAFCGIGGSGLSIRSLAKVLELFNIRIRIVVE